MCSALTSELQLLVSTMIMPLLGLVPAMRRALVLLPIPCTQAPRPVSKPSQVMVRATIILHPHKKPHYDAVGTWAGAVVCFVLAAVPLLGAKWAYAFVPTEYPPERRPGLRPWEGGRLRSGDLLCMYVGIRSGLMRMVCMRLLNSGRGMWNGRYVLFVLVLCFGSVIGLMGLVNRGV